MFKLRNNHGWSMKFENGVVVSVVFGAGTYSDNYNEDFVMPGERNVNIGCLNAEVAVIARDGEWLTQDCFKEVFDEGLCNNVAGYRSTNDIAKVIAWASSQPNTL